jgi:hypothetical protein
VKIVEGLIFIFALALALIGALLFLYFGIIPAMNGSNANMPITIFGVVLMIIGIGVSVVLGRD